MDPSSLPEWKKALLERKRAKRAAEASPLPSTDISPIREGERRRRRPVATSLSRLLELYSAMPGVRTIRADRIIIIETCPGEAAKRRVSGAAELRAEQVVVYEPEPGHVRRLRHQFDPVRAGGATRMCHHGAFGRKEASDCLLRMSEGQRGASEDQLRMTEGQRVVSGCPLRMCEWQPNASLRMPEDSSNRIRQSNGQEEASGAPLRMPERQSNYSVGLPEGAKEAPRCMRCTNGQEEASSGTLRIPGGRLATFRSQYVQKIAANSFVVNPRGRHPIDPKKCATDPREGEWPAAEKDAWPGAKVHKESAWAATPHTMHPKESAWPALPDSMVPKEITWLASPDTMRPKESAWAVSEQRATNPDDAGRQEGTGSDSPKGPGCGAAGAEESTWLVLKPYYGSRECRPTTGPRSVSPRGSEPHATNPKETSSLRDATDPKGRLRSAIATTAVVAPGAEPALSPNTRLHRNSRNSFQVIPCPRGTRAPRCPPAPQEADRVPITCIDDDATGSLAPLKVLSPRLEGCDISYDGSLAPDSEDAALGSGFESALLHNGSLEAPGSEFECAFSRSHYPRADEIEVIGGYLLLDRSCMSKAGARRRKKLKISFDDTRLHTMFEYPSENSLVAEEQEKEAEGEEEEEEYASEVDEAPPLPSTKRAAPSCRPNSGFSSYTPKLHSVEGGEFKEAPPNMETVAPDADSPDNHVMLTPAGTGALSDFRSEPALYF